MGLIGADRINLQDGQSAVVHFEGFGNKREDKPLNQPIELQSGITLQPKVIVSSRVFTEMNAYYVVKDDAMNSFQKEVSIYGRRKEASSRPLLKQERFYLSRLEGMNCLLLITKYMS